LKPRTEAPARPEQQVPLELLEQMEQTVPLEQPDRLALKAFKVFKV
jgi:hypothetical protein